MIRQYQKGDEFRLKPNRFSNFEDFKWVFDVPNFHGYTLLDAEEVMGIMCWVEHKPKEFATMAVIPDNLTMRHARELKRLVQDAILFLRPKSCVTYSEDCEIIDRWQKFFGFELKAGESRQVNGKNFNRWEMTWDSK